MRIVVMGVAGAGKTTVGERLAERLGAPYVDADELHPDENVAKMSAGIPLSDADREPWLGRTLDRLVESSSIVVSCSALKREYRDVLRRADDVRFVFLDADPAIIRGRVAGREGHFMKQDMIDSQFDALERPDPAESDVLTVAADRPIGSIVDDVLGAIGDRTGT